MDSYPSENDTVGSEQLFFKINNKQVIFKTDKRTVDKLNDGMFKNVKLINYIYYFHINEIGNFQKMI